MKTAARFAALLCASALLLTGCNSIGFTESFVFPEAGATYKSDERDEERGYLGVGGKPSKMIDMTSQQLVKTIRIGWNLGNSLDACIADLNRDWRVDVKPADGETVDETLWGNPTVTRELFKSLTDSGVNAVRIPISWRDHIDEDGAINSEWLNRVQQVVNFAYNCGMYVIINIQHDGAPDTQFGAWIRNASTDRDAVLAKYKFIWTQIAERFQNYNERLIFESMNEVRFDDIPHELGYEILNEFNAEFVNLIRTSGGNNANRHLIVAGYAGGINQTCDERFVVPDDPVDKTMVSVHCYFARNSIMESGLYKWGNEKQIERLESQLLMLKTRFTDNGIAVLVDEVGTENTEPEGDTLFISTVMEVCRKNGMAAFLWDDGKHFDREMYTWKNPALIETLNNITSEQIQ